MTGFRPQSRAAVPHPTEGDSPCITPSVALVAGVTPHAPIRRWRSRCGRSWLVGLSGSSNNRTRQRRMPTPTRSGPSSPAAAVDTEMRSANASLDLAPAPRPPDRTAPRCGPGTQRLFCAARSRARRGGPARRRGRISSRAEKVRALFLLDSFFALTSHRPRDLRHACVCDARMGGTQRRRSSEGLNVDSIRFQGAQAKPRGRKSPCYASHHDEHARAEEPFR